MSPHDAPTQSTATAVDQQIAAWNGASGRAWVDKHSVLDEMFQPLEDILVAGLFDSHPHPRSVLDVGCGAGTTTLAIARRLASAGGSAVGVDVSEPLLTLARDRAAGEEVPARFELGDVQEHDLGQNAFDAVVSRFGVMFFRAPVVAFDRLRRATTPDRALRMLVWRGPQDNPFMTAGETTAAEAFPDMPIRLPDTPGPFGLAGHDYALSVLERAGWREARAEPLDVPCEFAESELTGYLSSIGPVAQRLPLLDADDRTRTIEMLRRAYAPFVVGDRVRFVASCWMLTAVAPPRD